MVIIPSRIKLSISLVSIQNEVGLNNISSLILVVMILLVKIIGHVNIFVLFFLMITLTIFILVFFILIFFKGLCACFANRC